jgi:uncharacterized damage-inducible protein DinB
MRCTKLVAIALVAPIAAVAQSDRSPTSGAVASIVPLWERAKSLYQRSAEVMPEEKLSFRPTDQVRTFGQILGHVANDHYEFCPSALGEKSPNTQDFEKTTTRAGLLQALKDSFAYCDRAYRITDAQAVEQTEFFRSKGTRLWVLTYNILHDGEHYGNLVTYFRINGIVPPSTQSGQ